MSIEKYQFFDEKSLKLLANLLINKSNIRIGERIVHEVNADSTDKQVLSALDLYNLLSTLNVDNENIAEGLDEHDVQIENQTRILNELNTSQNEQSGKLTDIETGLDSLTSNVGDLNHLTIQSVTGPISEITDPRTDVLYFQRDNTADTMWMLYIYKDAAWVNIGDTEVDLSVIWSMDEVDELREALDIHDVADITDDELTVEIEAAFSDTAVTF